MASSSANLWFRRRFTELAELRRSARAAGVRIDRALLRAGSLATFERYSPAEIFALGLLGERGPIRVANYVSKQRTLEAQLRVNPRDKFDYTEDKVVFARLCAEHRLPVPRLRAILDPEGRDDGLGVPVARDAASLVSLLAHAPPLDLVLKPVEGVHGHGVQVLRFADGRFHSADGASTSIDALVAPWPDYRRWLLQDRLHPHPQLAALSGSPYLQTVRAVTCVDADGGVRVPIAWLRIIAAGNAFDNFNFGASGNLVATIAFPHGELEHVLASGGGRGGVSEATRHPDTGVSFADFRLPHAQAIHDLVARAARAFSPLRTIGWDVAVTEDGPLLIEGNVTWDPLPTKRDLRAIVAALE